MTRYSCVPVALALSVLLPDTASAAVRGVGPGCAFATVGAAVAAATNGDTIRIAAGNYAANLGAVTLDLTFEPGTANCGAFNAAAVVNISGAGARVMHVAGGNTVTIKNMRLGLGGGVNGGILQVSNGSTLYLEDVVLQNASVTNRGGCVLVDGGFGGANLIVTGASEMRECSADEGGAVYVEDGGVLSIGDTTTIVDNDADVAGGGVYVDNAIFLANQTANVSDNTTLGEGGGVYATAGSTVTLQGDSLVTGNQATLDGGGVAIVDTTGSGTNLWVRQDARVTFNTAVDGGGVFLDAADGFPTFTLSDDAAVDDNVAALIGGGVCALGDGATVITEGEPSISRNEADFGGGIWAQGDVVGRGGTIAYNDAVYDGGGVYLDDSPAGESHSLVNMHLDHNDADRNGGGLYVDATAEAVVDDDPDACLVAALAAGEYCSTLSSNLGVDGAGAYALGQLTVNHTALLLNLASNDGGALFVPASGAAAMTESLVTDTRALGVATAAVHVSGSLVGYHLTVADNATPGVRYTSGSAGVLANSILWGNTTHGLFVHMTANPLISCNDIGTIAGTGGVFSGNISANPLFIGAPVYELGPGSPAKDNCSRITTYDLGQQNRPASNTDMGAFEF